MVKRDGPAVDEDVEALAENGALGNGLGQNRLDRIPFSIGGDDHDDLHLNSPRRYGMISSRPASLAWSLFWRRSPSNWRRKDHSPSGGTRPNHVVPTGLFGRPPPGPAMPLMEIAMSALRAL